MIEYEDFDLRIRADGKKFSVFAQRGSQSTEEPFDLDLSRFHDFWQSGEQGLGESRDVGQPMERIPVATQHLGAALFDALIQGGVRDLYHQGRGAAGADAGKGLRIRIQIDPRDERLRPLLRLPWEILFDRSADASALLALDPRRPIVRTIDSTEATLSPPPGPLRRVLLAMSNPSGSALLDLDGERASVENALALVSIRPEILPHATRSRFQEEICDTEPQIVHFMGHGSFGQKLGEGLLLLEDEHGGQDPLSASILAGWFTGRPVPRLVILASCHSAEPGSDPAYGPFASVAAALVAAGLPAVVAMQTRVRDRSAIRFTERLYRRLALGDPIDAAVAHARIALQEERTETLDWAVPVLMVRRVAGSLENGELAPSGPSPSPSRPETVIKQVTSQRDVGFQQIFGYVHEVHMHGEPKK
jgi:hypothetical protein